jgi:hypothetical protein
MSKQKPIHEVEGIVRRAQRQDCVEAQIWGRVPKYFCSIDGPQEYSGLHHSSMEEVWNHQDSSELPACEQEQEPDGHSDRAPEFLCGNGKPSRKTTISAELARRKKAPKDSLTMRNKIVWSYETKIELFGLNSKCHDWRKPATNLPPSLR